MATNPVSLDPNYLDPATQDASTIPAFIRGAIDTSNVEQVYAPNLRSRTPDVNGATVVADAIPNEIDIYRPDLYTPAVRDHEMTHQFQETRSDGALPLPGGHEAAIFGQHPNAASIPYQEGDARNYDYGGEDGLLNAQADGKTITDFNLEQQADIVSKYKAAQDAYLAKAAAGTVTPKDHAAMDQTYRAYHPLVQQLASQPKNFRESLPSMKTVVGVGKPEPLAPAPAAPGLPYGVAGLGATPVDPLIGGKSVALPTGRNVNK